MVSSKCLSLELHAYQALAWVQVICSGHSLGAALASLCSVWASVQYPSADVLSVTIGQVWYLLWQAWIFLLRCQACCCLPSFWSFVHTYCQGRGRLCEFAVTAVCAGYRQQKVLEKAEAYFTVSCKSITFLPSFQLGPSQLSCLMQPYTGNQGWVDLYRNTVGREYRIVHQMDIVPSIPPTSGYRHVGLGIWELNNQVGQHSFHLCMTISVASPVEVCHHHCSNAKGQHMNLCAALTSVLPVCRCN